MRAERAPTATRYITSPKSTTYKGQAALDLYNTRLGQAQNFLQGKQPGDLWGAMMPAFGQAGTTAGMALQGVAVHRRGPDC
jgi:hypothetical protein